MKNTIRNTIRKGLIALIGLPIICPLLTAADLGVTTRTRFEQTENVETNARTAKTTLEATTKNGNFRLYNYDSSGKDYTALACDSPTLKLGETSTNILGFGTFGDQEGIGLESRTTCDNSTIYMNLEKAQAQGRDSTRIGTALDQKIGDLTLGAGFDNVTTSSGTTNYFLARAVYDATKTDQLGAAIRVAKSEETTTNSAIVDWCHYGKDEEWGHRTRFGIDDCNNGSQTYNFEIIGAQHPTFGKGSSPWMTSRGVYDGGMFNQNVVENALSSERVALGDRSNSGWVGTVCGSVTDKDANQTGFVKAEVGYKLPLTQNTSLALTTFGRNDLATGDNTLGGSALFRLNTKDAGSFAFEATADDDSNMYGSATYSIGF